MSGLTSTPEKHELDTTTDGFEGVSSARVIARGSREGDADAPCAARISRVSSLVLGFPVRARVAWQAHVDAAPGVVDGRGDVSRVVGALGRGLERRAAARLRSPVGRPGAELDHGRSAAVVAGSDRPLQCDGEAGGGRGTASDLVRCGNLRSGPLPLGRGRGDFPAFPRRLGSGTGGSGVPAGIEADTRDDAGAALRSPQSVGVRLDGTPVLPRMPVRLRVLRHHQALRPGAADQDQRADARGIRRPPLARLARTAFPGRRQLHRQ